MFLDILKKRITIIFLAGRSGRNIVFISSTWDGAEIIMVLQYRTSKRKFVNLERKNMDSEIHLKLKGGCRHNIWITSNHPRTSWFPYYLFPDCGSYVVVRNLIFRNVSLHYSSSWCILVVGWSPPDRRNTHRGLHGYRPAGEDLLFWWRPGVHLLFRRKQQN